MGVGFACDTCLVRRCRWQEDFLDGYLTAEALRQSNAPRARFALLGSARYNGTSDCKPCRTALQRFITIAMRVITHDDTNGDGNEMPFKYKWQLQ